MPESSDQKKASIPSWQRQSQAPERTEPDPMPDESPKEAPPPSRAALLEQASRFLQEDDIREASTDRKISFLESKGLTNEEISKLLGVSRNTAASSSSSTSSPTPEPESMDSQAVNPPPTYPIKMGHRAKTPQNPPPPQPSISPSQPPPLPSQPQSQTSPIPPIITYPEFLLNAHPPKPAALLTLHRLLSTLYATSALAASLYGLSQYVLKPMTSALTSARHELAETTLADLDKLHAKLEAVVSELPPDATRPSHAPGTASEQDGEGGADSEDEDPTELFHRDIGTQTSPAPSLSRRNSSDSSSMSSTSAPTTPVTTQTTALQSIHTHLASLLAEDSARAVTDESVKDRVADLQAYLDGLAYASSSYVNGSVGGVYGMYGSGSGGGATGGGSWSGGIGSGGGKGAGGGQEDAIARVKAEIRGVKGVLLSARNFPGSAGGTGRVGGSIVR